MDFTKLNRSSVQFDYFSDNYNRFKTDFNKYANMVIPLPFLTENILLTMSEAQVNYFRLPFPYSKDNRDHFFIFKVSMQSDNQQVRTYEYLRHALSLNKK